MQAFRFAQDPSPAQERALKQEPGTANADQTGTAAIEAAAA
jgi:hypothetical protein